MNIHSTDGIGKRVRAVATAMAIGVAVLSLGTGQAEAKPKRPEPKLCTYTLGGTIYFYLPGEIVDLGDGNKFRCGKDGKWHQVRVDVTPDEPAIGDGGVYAT